MGASDPEKCYNGHGIEENRPVSQQQNRIPHPQEISSAEGRSAEESARYKKASDLLAGWMKAEDSYDEEVWPLVEEELKNSRMRCGD